MRPSRIRVFDGLRITTEHLDHLQSAFSSAVVDLREIAGLAVVQRGLEVTTHDGKVTVAPGLAFDRQGNRVTCDEPLTVPITFERLDETKYVCLRYQQVEDGVVEGQPTLVFDSCDVALEPALPEETDSLVAIARIVNTSAGAEVRPIDEPVPVDSTPAAAAAANVLRVGQGVIRMTGPVSALDLSTLPRSLRETELALDFVPTSVSAHVLLLATVALPPPADVSEGTVPATARAECRADGEATLDASGVSQFSVSACPSPEFSDGDLGRLFLDMPQGSGLEALRSAYLTVRLVRSAAGTLTVACSLEWSGALSEESTALVRDRQPSLSWQALCAWKALGAPADH